jgi:hypothetical protein
MAYGWMLKLKFCLKTTRERVHLDKWKWKIMDIPTSFVWSIILFDEGFKNDNNSKFWFYIRTKSEPLCVEICNFV